MDEPTLNPRFSIGDFVKCLHVYYNYHYYYNQVRYDEPPEAGDFYYGIVVDIDYAMWDGYEDDFEIIYVVYCLDGSKRFFSENEVYKLS